MARSEYLVGEVSACLHNLATVLAGTVVFWQTCLIGKYVLYSYPEFPIKHTLRLTEDVLVQ